MKNIDIESLNGEQLYDHAKELLSMRNLFTKCHQKRVEFRDKFITEYERDEGHEYMLAKIEDEIQVYEQLLTKVFFCIESIPDPQPVKQIEEDQHIEIIPTRKNRKKKQRKKPFNQQLREAGVDVSAVNREISLQNQAANISNEIIADVDKCNMNKLLRKAHKNPYIWQIAIKYAYEKVNVKVMVESYEHVKYLSEQFPYLRDLLWKVETILILEGHERLIDHIPGSLIDIPDDQTPVRIHPFIKYILQNGNRKAKENILRDILEYIKQEYRYIRNINILQMVVGFGRAISKDDELVEMVNTIHRQVLNMAIIHNYLTWSISCNSYMSLHEIFSVIFPQYAGNITIYQRLPDYTIEELEEEILYAQKIPHLFKGIYRCLLKGMEDTLHAIVEVLKEELDKRNV